MKELDIRQFVVGPIQTNCYFAVHHSTKETLVIDPGAYGERLAQKLKEYGNKPVAILLTHGHYDHVDGLAGLLKALGEALPVYAHEAERETLGKAELNRSLAFDGEARVYAADHFLKDEEEITLAGFRIRVFHTPGHTDGGCCYYFPEEDVVFTGDSLFAGSIGRTDFPHGSMSALVRSVKEKIMTLPDETVVLPGHEASSTVGEEKLYNPFMAG